MTGVSRKRKASSQLEDSSKGLRVEDVSATDFEGQSDDENDDEYQEEDNGFSDNGQIADTPATPLSPARKKFPSELKHLECTYEGCTKSFNRPIRLQNHLKTHTNERTFLCQYEGCDKAYFEDKHLQAHIKGSHTHERKHACEWEGCRKSFLTATRLRRHIATHEGHERFRCRDFPPCNQTFRKHQTLQRHIRSDHLELAPYPCKFVDPITNQPCHAGFDGASGLRRHEEVAHGAAQFFCANCVIPFAFNVDGSPIHPGFATNSQLQSHIRKEHTNTICIFCDKQCSNERQLQIHIESQHSGTTLEQRKIISCTYEGCDKTFTKKSNLNIHIRTVHMGERFICGELDTSNSKGLEQFDPDAGCGLDFMSKQYLEDHIRVSHLGQQSSINVKRTGDAKHETLAGFIDDEDDDGSYHPHSRKRKRKAKYSTLQKMVGDRSVPASALKDEPQFEYGLNPAPANQAAGDIFASWPPALGIENEPIPLRGAVEEPLDNIDWQLQQQALQGGPFWIGGESSFEPTNYDLLWTQEEREMRRLIGDGN